MQWDGKFPNIFIRTSGIQDDTWVRLPKKLSECRRQSPPNRGASEKFMTANDQAMKIRKLEERNRDFSARSLSSASQIHSNCIQQPFLDSPDNDHPAALKASTVEETVNLTGNFPVNESRMKDLFFP